MKTKVDTETYGICPKLQRQIHNAKFFLKEQKAIPMKMLWTSRQNFWPK